MWAAHRIVGDRDGTASRAQLVGCEGHIHVATRSCCEARTASVALSEVRGVCAGQSDAADYNCRCAGVANRLGLRSARSSRQLRRKAQASDRQSERVGFRKNRNGVVLCGRMPGRIRDCEGEPQSLHRRIRRAGNRHGVRQVAAERDVVGQRPSSYRPREGSNAATSLDRLAVGHVKRAVPENAR